MILIASAAYVDQDLSAEVGLLPPSFLPIGNKRLFEHQIDFFSDIEDDIYLSLPTSFQLNESDNAILSELNVQVLFVPDGISLGESVLYSWNATGKHYSQLTILHGDTLFLEHNFELGNFVSVSSNKGAYNRAEVICDSENSLIGLKQIWVNDNRTILSGLFGFSAPQLLMKCLVERKNDFVGALLSYSSQENLACLHFDSWLDFGHLNSFFSSRTTMTTQRIFNDLIITSRSVTKQSEDALKMNAESTWFKHLPSQLHIYTPALLKPFVEGPSKASYAIEYLYLLPLSDLFVFGQNSVDTWKQIFISAIDVISDFRQATSQVCVDIDISTFDDIYLKKTLLRLTEFKQQNSVNNEILIDIAQQSSNYIRKADDKYCTIVHGDFCFSNLLYDSRTQSLKLIDPRGLDSQRELTLLGDQRYDIAKLFHSAVGCYDLIIAGCYYIEGDSIKFYNNDRLQLIEKAFEDIFCHSASLSTKQELLAINVHLFLSMLPLHSDRPDRQKAMILNAKRLFNKLMDSL